MRNTDKRQIRGPLAPFKQFDPENEKKYLDSKFREMRPLAIVLSIGAPAIMGGLWVWDYFVDPVNASATLALRIVSGLLFLLYGLTVALRLPRRAQICTLIVCGLIGESIFLVILSRLQYGLLYGLGGYLYFYLGLIIISFVYSFRSVVTATICLAVVPNFLPLFGIGKGLSLPIYNIYVWSALFLVVSFVYFADRTLRKKFLLQQEIEELATIDVLSGLSNRRSFLEKGNDWIDLARRYHRSACMVILDIDRFKSVNDSYGHTAGDKVISAVANVLRKTIRRSDIAARIGGDEFAIIFPEMRTEDAIYTTEQIRSIIENIPFEIDNGRTVACTISAGIADYQPGIEDMDLISLMSKADDALYRAKNAGRNRIELNESPEKE